MNPVIDQIINLCVLHNINIVSYGLAPNPFGFCYEVENTSCAAAKKLDELLDSLSEEQELELKKVIFG